MILGGGLHHKVSTRHSGNVFSYPSQSGCVLRNKKVSQDLNLRPQGSIFPIWLLYHYIPSVPMAYSLQLYCYQAASLPHPCKHTEYPLLPCKQPVSLPLMCNQAESPLLLTWMPSLGSLYGKKLFPHCYILQKYLQSTCPKAGFTSDPNDFTPKSKNFTLDSNNPFHHPGLVLINSLSCRAINPEWHLLWAYMGITG